MFSCNNKRNMMKKKNNNTKRSSIKITMMMKKKKNKLLKTDMLGRKTKIVVSDEIAHSLSLSLNVNVI